MIKRIEYNIQVVNITKKHIDFEIGCTEENEISFLFFYRKDGAGEWRDKAHLYSENAKSIKNNLVSGFTLEESKGKIRWYYTLDNINFNDQIEIEIQPEVNIKTNVFNGNGTFFLKFDPNGISNIEHSNYKRFYSDTYILDNKLYYNNDILFENIDSNSVIQKYYNENKYNFIIFDFVNEKITEVDENKNVINNLTVNDITYGTYHESLKNILYSTNNNVYEIDWSHDNYGSILWDYDSVYSSLPLNNVTFCSYGSENKVTIVSNDTVICVNTDMNVFKEISELYYKRENSQEEQNKYELKNISSAYEIYNDRFVIIEKSGMKIDFEEEQSHTSYQRSLGDYSNNPIHSAFYNTHYKPINTNTNGQTELTIENLNSKQLFASLRRGYINNNFNPPILDLVKEGLSRGNITEDSPFWGIREAYNKGTGMQSIAVLTGQEVVFNFPFNGRKTGYMRKDKSIVSVFVSEDISLKVIDTDSGLYTDCIHIEDFHENRNCEFSIPNANNESYQKSLTKGSHYNYIFELNVTEKYYSDKTMKTEIFPQKTFVNNIYVTVFWWRQVFKEINNLQSPIKNDFTLEDYEETVYDFFDRYTFYPDYYRQVGQETLSIDSSQKKKIIYDNCFSLLTFYSGILIGNSPLCDIFGSSPVKYIEPKSDYGQSQYVESVRDNTNPLSGLNAIYTSKNIFENNPNEICNSNQYITDVYGVLITHNDIFSSSWGQNGFLSNCVYGENFYESLHCLDGIKRLSFKIDKPGLRVENIDVYGKYSNVAEFFPGDETVLVKFYTEDDPKQVSIGVSVNDGPYFTFLDTTGETRERQFNVQTVINENTVINVMVELIDEDGKTYTYYATQKAYTESKSTFITNVKLSLDKKGKRLLIKYDLYTKYNFIMYKVDLKMIRGVVTNISNLCQGDIGMMHSGNSKMLIINYGQEFAEALLRSRTMFVLTVSPVGYSDSPFDFQFSVNFKSTDLWDNEIKEETDFFITKKDDIKISPKVSDEHVYYHERKYSNLRYIDRGAYNIPSSSSSFSYSSSSDSSSSADIYSNTGYLVYGAGIEYLDGIYHYYRLYNERNSYVKDFSFLFMRYLNEDTIKWALVDDDDNVYYYSSEDSEFPPTDNWNIGEYGISDIPQIAYLPVTF